MGEEWNIILHGADHGDGCQTDRLRNGLECHYDLPKLTPPGALGFAKEDRSSGIGPRSKRFSRVFRRFRAQLRVDIGTKKPREVAGLEKVVCLMKPNLRAQPEPLQLLAKIALRES
jgi:hypothetical protein